MVNYFLVLEGEREITVLGTFLQVDEVFRHDGLIQFGVELELDVFRIVIRKVEFKGNRASNLLGLRIHRLCDKLSLKSLLGCQINGKIFVFHLEVGHGDLFVSELLAKRYRNHFLPAGDQEQGKQDEGCEQLDFIHFQSTGLENLEH